MSSYSDFKSRYTKKGKGKKSTSRTGSSKGSNKKSTAKSKSNVFEQEGEFGFSDVDESGVTDVPTRTGTDFLESQDLPESRTAMGVREGRDFEQGLLESALAEAREIAERDSASLATAERDYEEAAAARDRTIYTGPFDPGRGVYGPDAFNQYGRLEGREYYKSPIARATLGSIITGDTDSETLDLASKKAERELNRLQARGRTEGSQYRLELLQEAVDSGLPVVELRKQLGDDIVEQTKQLQEMTRQTGLKEQSAKLFGGREQPFIEENPAYQGTGRRGEGISPTGLFSDHYKLYDLRKQLAAERDRNMDLLAVLPSTDPLVEGEPFSEQQFSDPLPNIKGDPFAGGLPNPPQKSDDEILRDSLFESYASAGKTNTGGM